MHYNLTEPNLLGGSQSDAILSRCLAGPILATSSPLVKFDVRHYSADQHAVDLRKIDAFPPLAEPGADAPRYTHGTASGGTLRMFVKRSARSEVPRPETKKQVPKCGPL